uniref:Secreted protein n=1 Tax=Ascaris lumbricoides TaxID=6252 RepID=A0A0M3IPS1_ASCLU
MAASRKGFAFLPPSPLFFPSSILSSSSHFISAGEVFSFGYMRRFWISTLSTFLTTPHKCIKSTTLPKYLFRGAYAVILYLASALLSVSPSTMLSNRSDLMTHFFTT